MYTIGRLARRTRVNADSIRFYERQGLLAPSTKTASGYRLYSDDAVRRVAFVKHAQRCGFALIEIRQLLDLHKVDEQGRASAFDLAAEKQAQIQETLKALNAMSEALTARRGSASSAAYSVFSTAQASGGGISSGRAR